MGGGSYNSVLRSARAESKAYYSTTSANLDVTFKQSALRQIHESLSPKGVLIRECRDSSDHPDSYAIILNIDLTGSMGVIPAMLVSTGLPSMIERMFTHGILHPAIEFVGIGDHEADRFPLQIGQFESSDEKLDMDLTNLYPEKGGGGNSGESYMLAWYHAAKYTAIDCLEKRGKKGLLVTIGDEPCLPSVPGSVLAELYGQQSERDYTSEELLAMAREKYHVYHINCKQTSQGSSLSTKNYWNQLLGTNCIHVEDANDIPEIIANLAQVHHATDGDGQQQSSSSQQSASGASDNNPTPSTNSGTKIIL